MTRLAVALTVLLGLGVPAAADHPAKVTATMPFTAGPLPGSPQVVIKLKKSARYCGGIGISALIKKSKKTSPPDPVLAAVFRIAPPTGLDFSPDDEAKRTASMKKFTAWYEAINDAVMAADKHYGGAADKSGLAPVDRAAAAARLVQVIHWIAQSVARAEVPANVARFPEAVEVYCDTLNDKAAPMATIAVDNAAACRHLIKQEKLEGGWWDAVCAP